MIAAYGTACCYIALAHDKAGNEERIVMMLFVGGEYDAVANLTARQCRVVADNCIVETKSKLQMHMLAKQKTYGYDTVFQCAAISYHTIT